ncbi:hypothetical protein ACFFWD_25970 [Bradyrhizobium erythrophlei]|uniref:hypothetical protein n=1 Tax=Bradyrhizobium erythrophlei TaxID=1437360 RepID=UPI0035F03AB8
MKCGLLAIPLLSMVCGAAFAAPFNIEEASIATIQKAIKSKQITCEALVTKYLDRIDAYDQKGPALDTAITVNPHARDTAAHMDADFKKNRQVGWSAALCAGRGQRQLQHGGHADDGRQSAVEGRQAGC